jgi:hypothetical protein
MLRARPIGALPFLSGGFLVVGLAAAACGGGPTQPRGSLIVTFDFAAGPLGWSAGFADYPAGQESFYELTQTVAPLPPPLAPGRSAWFLSGNNHSDDLFMFLARRLDGLRPAAVYRASFTVEIATDVPRGCGGVGGAPGESVFLKAGASGVEPRVAADAFGWLRLTVDKGNQATGGANAVVLGTIENTTSCEDGIRRWELKALESAPRALTVTADGSGAVWLLVGTDSGFESTTSIFYTRVGAAFEPQ